MEPINALHAKCCSNMRTEKISQRVAQASDGRAYCLEAVRSASIRLVKMLLMRVR